MNQPSGLSCWAISDGAAGNERQASALAGVLGGAIGVLRIHVRETWTALAPRLVGGAHFALPDSQCARCAHSAMRGSASTRACQ